MAANTNFAVAVHALSVLAYTGELATSEYLATSINTNAVVVRRVMRHLVNADLVRSVAGKNGGFELALPPEEIQLTAVRGALNEDSVFRVHANEENPVCTVSCAIKPILAEVLADVDAAVDHALAKTTLADIVRQLA